MAQESHASAGSGQHTGIALLKIILSFLVVWSHFGHGDTGSTVHRALTMGCSVAVPSFMLLSFYFCGRHFLNGEVAYFGRRIIRLALPHIVWTFLYFMAFRLMGDVYTWDAVRAQLLGGSSINPPMWYMTVLLLLTVVFFLVCLIFGKNSTYPCAVLLFASLWLQYAGINRHLFAGLGGGGWTTVGRICEMVPYACLGILFAQSDALRQAEKNKLPVLLSSLAGIAFLVLFDVFTLPEGYGYQGISLIVKSILVIMLFYTFTGKYFSSSFGGAIRTGAGHTLGIYCMHWLVGKSIQRIAGETWADEVVQCLLIFVISLLLSLLIARIPSKWTRMLVV